MATEWGPSTLAAQALGRVEPRTGALVPGIEPATTFERDPDGGYRSGHVYARADNPTFRHAEDLLTALEGGADSLLFASGMAAATAVFQALDPGDHVVVPKVMYWALRGWLSDHGSRWGLAVEPVDTTDLDALAAALQPGRTRLVWLETPANPLWEISDIAAAAELAHRAGARLAVDSTVATPVLTRPLALGADLVMHSATKYLNGHSDVIAGTLTTAREDEWWDRLKSVRARQGGIAGSFEAWLLLRGMRTLFLRVRHCCQSAQLVAERHGEASARGAGPLSGPAGLSRPRGRRPPDDRRLRRHAVDPRARRRGGRDRHGGAGEPMEARHLAGWGGEPDRAPSQHRGSGLASAARSPSPLGRDRGARGPDRRPGDGAGGLSAAME